jgi:2-methylisocitrate lyase-like PEP mutase family enzyme
MDTKAKAGRLRALHAAPRALLIANAWDAGSARILAGMGFEALATSSGACAGVLGRKDMNVTRDEAIAHGRVIAAAVSIPVSADLEKGFGDTPADAAETIRRAAEAGLAGGSIEDATGDTARPLLDIGQSVERIAAAAEAGRASGFVLTARTENFLWGNPSLDDTIRKLQAFEKAGADVLMAPGLPDLDAVKAVCSSLSKPFSFMVGIRGKSWSVAELEAAGVRRISFATSLFRAAMGGLIEAASEIREKGTFGYLDRGPSGAEVFKHFQK